MGQQRQSLFVRVFLILCTLLFIAYVTIELVQHPMVATKAESAGIVYAVLIVLAVMIYGWFALFQTRTRTKAEYISQRDGIIWGLVCGSVWAVELLVANLPVLQTGALPGPLHLILYRTSGIFGFLLPAAAGLMASWHTRQIKPGLSAGLLCGMFGGLIIFLTYLLASNALYQAGLNDPQTIQEFHRSSLPDLSNYMVSDWLAAMIGHLWIGIITGLALGLAGGALGKVFARLACDPSS